MAPVCEKEIEFHIDFQYKERSKKALDSVEGTVEKGKCVVLCGSSGCGKSTLLRVFNLLIPQFYEGEMKGFCLLENKNTKELSIGEAGKIASSVFQDPRSQFFTMNSSTEVAFGLENFGFSKEEMEQRVERVFKEFHLENLKNRNVFELSSGERQLVAILAARAVNTELYLLDEPTANLDSVSTEKLEKLLLELKKQGKTLVISEHRLSYLSSIADEFWFMEKGQIQKRFSAEEMNNLSVEQLKELGLRTLHSEIPFDEEARLPWEKPKTIHEIEGKDLLFCYKKGGKEVLKNCSFKGKTGDSVGIVGRNGCGKTTLGKILTGLYEKNGGTLLFDKEELKRKSLQSKGIFIMQEAEFQFFTGSVMEELCYLQKSKKDVEKRKEEAKPLLQKLGLWPFRNRHPFSLSGGQMQKLVLLLAYFSEKPLVLLDEPTSGLDYRSLVAVSELILEMRKTKIVFVISHDGELLSKVCNRAFFMEKGQVKREFQIETKEDFALFQKYTSENLKEKGEEPSFRKRTTEKESLLHPCSKILLFLLAMIVGIGTNGFLILPVFCSLFLAFLLEKQWKIAVFEVISVTLLYGSYMLFPSVVTAFIISFFPRMFVICFGALPLLSEKEVPRTLAALRKLHVPEKIIMVLSVMFRFFPVLRKDLKIMSESLKTRGFFQKLSEKLRAVPEYLEIMVVPMVFRVIRIAETLSASAETRGIALKNKRSSYITLKAGVRDAVILSVTVLLFTAGVIIQIHV